jgi:hypothetical protein
MEGGVRWSSPGVFNARVTREALEGAFGPPFATRLDSNGTGLFDAWAIRFECGLEVTLWLFEPPEVPSGVEVYANEDDAPHVLRHLGLPEECVVHWRAPDGAWTDDVARAFTPRRFRVVRRDDHGRAYTMLETASRRDATCLVEEYEIE